MTRFVCARGKARIRELCVCAPACSLYPCILPFLPSPSPPHTRFVLLTSHCTQFEKAAGSSPDDKVKVELLDDQVSMHTTNVFLEAGTATSHTADAYQLLMPVFRVLVCSRK